MLTKADFQQAIANSIANYPSIAPFYQAGDPRILQSLDAVATMFGMLSNQAEVAMMEPFEKVRDATVLADAAMRGVIRKATPGRVRLLAKNNTTAPFTVETGRGVLDSVGNNYLIDTSIIVAPGATGTFEAVQVKRETIRHTVTNSAPFYAIEIPEATDDTYLSGISVSDSVGEYEYRERYVNTWPGERVYHVEADDRQRIYVRFGMVDVVATQPNEGMVVTLEISRTAGEISTVSGSPFSFEYLLSPLESGIVLTMDAMLQKGINPPDMANMRELAKYPSIYDHSAVFMGEFDFLVRRNFPRLQFLSVWNESVEERVRGPDMSNINTLFVACLDEDEQVQTEVNFPLQPLLITSLTATQQAILDTIKKADDSYKVKFFTPIRSKINISVTATVSTSFIASVVQSQIAETLLSEFGESAVSSKHGSNTPLYQQIYSLLKLKIPALSSGRADMQVSITDPVGGFRPELWRYADANSLNITVNTANVTVPSWGR
jgi:hypothetical protein